MNEPLPTSDPEPQFLALPHGPLAYADEGPRDAPVLVAVHGIPGSLRDFRYLPPQLCGGVRLVRLDMPGFGASAPLDEAIDSVHGRARVVLEAADRLGLAEFAVLGHSMGGAAALLVAAGQPQRVTRLLLVASVGFSLHRGLGLPPLAFRLVARGLRLPLLRSVLTPISRRQYRKRRFPGADQMDAAAFSLQLRALGATDFEVLRHAAGGSLPPALVAYAHDDHMVETWISEELARQLPQARVLSFEAGGHNIQKTRAVELAQAIQRELGVR